LISSYKSLSFPVFNQITLPRLQLLWKEFSASKKFLSPEDVSGREGILFPPSSSPISFSISTPLQSLFSSPSEFVEYIKRTNQITSKVLKITRNGYCHLILTSEATSRDILEGILPLLPPSSSSIPPKDIQEFVGQVESSRWRIIQHLITSSSERICIEIRK